MNVLVCCSKPWQLQQSQMLSCFYNKRSNIAKYIYSLQFSLPAQHSAWKTAARPYCYNQWAYGPPFKKDKFVLCWLLREI